MNQYVVSGYTVEGLISLTVCEWDCEEALLAAQEILQHRGQEWLSLPCVEHVTDVRSTVIKRTIRQQQQVMHF
jgi:hypothetical protein